MSPRAAWRLESLGFEQVHDYVAGKMDWLASALPYDGEADLLARHVVTDVATCRLDERVGEVAARVEGGGHDFTGFVVVVNDAGVVLGRLHGDALDGDGDRLVADAMYEGPTTVRPSEDVEGLAHRMEHAGVPAIIVTRPDGTLVGVYHRT